MGLAAVGKLLNQIGILLSLHAQEAPKTVFLYVEAGPGWVGPSLFKVLPDRLVYIKDDHELDEALMKLWKAEKPDKRWAVMQYEVKDGKFDAIFEFEEDIDPDEGFDRRERILRERYGDRPVDYPPISESAYELRLEE